MEENKKEFDESIVEDASSEECKEEAKSAETEVDGTEAEAPGADDEKAEGTEAAEEKGKKMKKKSAAALEIELDKSEKKVAEMTDKYQRLMAEFEKARKRNAKEQSHMYDVGAKEVLAKLLPVVDNFERGLDALSEEEKATPFAQGIEKIYQQLSKKYN